MRGQHLERALGSDQRANTEAIADCKVPVTDGDVSTAWAIAFVVVVSLGLLSPFF
jgi:hypothetical protein